MPAKVKSRSQDRDYEDLVRLYLEDVGLHNLLTKDDEIRLAQAIEQGIEARTKLETTKKVTPTQRRQLRRTIRQGEEAHRQFVNSNLRLVVSIAKKYQSSGLPLLDIVQEGNLGLIHAVDKFDWRKGFKFSTYATWWIRQAIQRGIANSARVIRLPVHAGDMLTALLKLRARSSRARWAARRRWPSWPTRPSCRSRRSSKCSATRSTRSRSTSPSATTVTPSSATSSRTATRWRRSTTRPRRCCPARSPRSSPSSTTARRRSSRCASASTGRRAHARRGGRALRPHPGADPSDRGPGHVEAAAPLGRHRRPRAARSRLISDTERRTSERPPCGAAVSRPDSDAIASQPDSPWRISKSFASAASVPACGSETPPSATIVWPVM